MSERPAAGDDTGWESLESAWRNWLRFIAFRGLSHTLVERRGRQPELLTAGERYDWLAASSLGGLVLPPGSQIGNDLNHFQRPLIQGGDLIKEEYYVKGVRVQCVPDRVRTIIEEVDSSKDEAANSGWSRSISLQFEYDYRHVRAAQAVGVEINDKGEAWGVRREWLDVHEVAVFDVEAERRPIEPAQVQDFTTLIKVMQGIHPGRMEDTM